MRIRVLTTNKSGQKEFGCDPDITLRDLRFQLAETYRTQWDKLELYVVNNNNDNKLSPIYTDDNADIELVKFIQQANPGKVVDVNTVTLLIFKHEKLAFFRPTYDNPKGLNNEEEMKKKSKKTFTQRLSDIQFPLDQVPLEFIDTFTNEVMENPVITITQKSMDASTAVYMLNYGASMAQLYQVSRPNLLLRSKFEDFVTQQERLYKKGQLITLAKSEAFLSECDEDILRIKTKNHQTNRSDNIGMDAIDSPRIVSSDVEDQLMIEDPKSISFIDKLDRIEVAKLLVLTTIYNAVSTDIKRRGYSNLLLAFKEANDVYLYSVSADIRLSVHSVMKLHRKRCFRENPILSLIGKIYLPSSARHLRRMGFFNECPDVPYKEPQFIPASDEIGMDLHRNN